MLVILLLVVIIFDKTPTNRHINQPEEQEWLNMQECQQLHQRQAQDQLNWQQIYSGQGEPHQHEERSQQEESSQPIETNHHDEINQQPKEEPQDEEQEYKNEFTINEIQKCDDVLKRTRTFFIKK